MPVKLSCETCKKDFYVDPYRIKANAKYCSKQCFLKQWENRYVFNCQNCGKEHSAYGYTEGRKKYCSKQCMEEFRHTPLETLLMNHVEKRNNGCWEWTGALSRKTGYGKITYNQKTISTHRASYLVFKGEISKGKHICHSCDNKKCVNPEHLWAGTAKENMQDMIKKGRQADQTGKVISPEHFKKLQHGRLNNWPSREGSKHHLAKLDEKKVMEIKKMIKDGYTNKEIAEIYNVDQSNISLIRNGKRWSHVNH